MKRAACLAAACLATAPLAVAVVLGSLTLPAAPARAEGAPLADFLGRWSPQRDTNRGLLRLRISLREGVLRLSARGGCREDRCLWGRSSARAYGIGPTAKVERDTRIIVADLRATDSTRRLLMIRLLKGGRLQVQALVRGPEGTTPYYNVFMMKRRLRDVRRIETGAGGSDRAAPGREVGKTAAETCTSFDPDLVLALPIRGEWRLIHLGYTLKSFGNRRWQAERAARLIRKYRLSSRCHAATAGHRFEYWRTAGGIPSGPSRGEDCLRVYPGDAKLTPRGRQWQVTGWQQTYAATDTGPEARYVLQILQRYNPSHLCKIGNGARDMVYLRR